MVYQKLSGTGTGVWNSLHNKLQESTILFQDWNNYEYENCTQTDVKIKKMLQTVEEIDILSTEDRPDHLFSTFQHTIH